jgi:ubiquinone/menaquinone biosynthesis C-methylase UbiE
MLRDWLLSRAAVFEWQQRLCNNYGSLREHFHAYLDVAGKDILDVGCATGSCGATIVPLKRNRYVGIDVVPQYVARAAQRFPAARFLTMDARRLDFADASFDIVLFIGVIHHLDDGLVRDCFRDIRRVLRPDGVILCAEPVLHRDEPLSTILLKWDRGRYIRSLEDYRRLFDGFDVAAQSWVRLSVHKLCSFVLRRAASAAAAA